MGDRERPKTEELVKALEEAEDALAGSQKVLEQNRTHLRADSEVLKALTAQQEERSSVVTEHTRLESLYSRLSGKVPGARMDIETYVQRYYLERILAAAEVVGNTESDGFASRLGRSCGYDDASDSEVIL